MRLLSSYRSTQIGLTTMRSTIIDYNIYDLFCPPRSHLFSYSLSNLDGQGRSRSIWTIGLHRLVELHVVDNFSCYVACIRLIVKPYLDLLGQHEFLFLMIITIAIQTRTSISHDLILE